MEGGGMGLSGLRTNSSAQGAMDPVRAEAKNRRKRRFGDVAPRGVVGGFAEER